MAKTFTAGLRGPFHGFTARVRGKARYSKMCEAGDVTGL